MERILRLPELLTLLGLSRTTLYNLISQDQFPRQIRLSPRTSGWKLSEVQNWIEDRAQKRGGAA